MSKLISVIDASENYFKFADERRYTDLVSGSGHSMTFDHSFLLDKLRTDDFKFAILNGGGFSTPSHQCLLLSLECLQPSYDWAICQTENEAVEIALQIAFKSQFNQGTQKKKILVVSLIQPNFYGGAASFDLRMT
jgi:acetylornithine/succinyldiaminopimelate/putrescine aminotransferase